MMRLRYDAIYVGVLTALAAGTALLLTGCQGAVQKPDPVEPPLPPSVLGVWKTTSGWYEEDGHVGTRKHTLVFTPGRAIETVEHVCDVAVCPEDDEDWTSSGTWETDGSTITRTWLDDEQRVSVLKEYHFLAEGNMMVMSPPWDNDDLDYGPMDDDFRRYTRVASLDPAQLFGVWKDFRTREDDEEGLITWTFTITVTPDGSFVYANLRESSERSRVYTFSGTYTVDIENLFVLQTVTEVEWLEDGEPDTLPPAFLAAIGGTFRWGVAPTSSPDRLAVSPMFQEHGYDDEIMEWQDTHMYCPFGCYWLYVEKQ